jgi:hypothetical protein
MEGDAKDNSSSSLVQAKTIEKANLPVGSKLLGFSLIIIHILCMQVQSQLVKMNQDWNNASAQECLFYQYLISLPLFYVYLGWK